MKLQNIINYGENIEYNLETSGCGIKLIISLDTIEQYLVRIDRT